jgi:hypothetical protein
MLRQCSRLLMSCARAAANGRIDGGSADCAADAADHSGSSFTSQVQVVGGWLTGGVGVPRAGAKP